MAIVRPHLFEVSRGSVGVIREEVSVPVVGDADRRVPRLRLDDPRVGAAGDPEGDGGVAEIVRT